MHGVNKVILVGNVGKDPVVRYVSEGQLVCNFPLATNETFTDKDGVKVTNTEWHQIVTWRKLAEVAEKYIKKGDPIYIEGKIVYRQWVAKDGTKKFTAEIVATTLTMLGSKEKEEQDDKSKLNNEIEALEKELDLENMNPDDLPF